MNTQHRADASWIAFWVAFAVFDEHADDYGWSLSDTIRRVFHVHTPIGRRVFTFVVFGIGPIILHRHILKKENEHG